MLPERVLEREVVARAAHQDPAAPGDTNLAGDYDLAFKLSGQKPAAAGTDDGTGGWG